MEVKRIVGIKKCQKKTIKLAWLIMAGVFVLFAALNVVDYIRYRSMQTKAIGVMAVATGVDVDNYSREELCDRFHSQLQSRYGGTVRVNGYTIDMSDVARSQNELISSARDAFEEVFDYPYYDVQYIFEFTGMFSHMMTKITRPFLHPGNVVTPNYILFGLMAIYFVLLLATQLKYNKSRKMGIVVTDEEVLCIQAPGKEVSVPISRIQSVRREKYSGLKIQSPGTKFKITMLENHVEIIDAITDRMNASAVIPSAPQADEAERLTKLKKLADAGIITEEEFEAKKKQLLGL